ncbi:MAG: cytochrome c oxidase subunit 4 [Brachybacterium sp.]|nr:cytochrome c oxidase subunit 4 [Brachybacterium sp.]
MRTSAKIFWILGVFFLVVAIIYGFLTYRYEPLGIETVGFPAVLALSALGFMIAMALTIALRKHDQGASDDLEGEVSESAGVQGSFAPYSWAPLWLAIGAALCFLGVAAGWWIFAFGILFATYGLITWVLEFSSGQHAH